jgi:hypothetical protein
MRSLKAPDFASRFNVMLYREPICVLVLCTDSTSKVLQIQQVVAATRESACTGAQRRKWLRGQAGIELLKPAAEGRLRMWPVSRRVNKTGQSDDEPTLLDEVAG